MYCEEVLPKFEHINIDIGLKFLNSNRKLYLKILNSFLDRYEHIDILALDNEELESVIHTIKGLSATLGMEELNRLTLIMDRSTEDYKEGLNESLTLVIIELKREL